MLYLAVQVLTSREAEVAHMIEKNGKLHGVELDVFVPGKDIVKFDKKDVNGMNLAKLRGYVFVGFKRWEDRLYRIIKDAWGVIRVLTGQVVPYYVTRPRPKRKHFITGVMSKSEMSPWLTEDSEDEVAVEITEDQEALAEKLKHQIVKCREFVEQKRTSIKRWLAVPVHLVEDLFDNATLEFLTNERGAGFRSIWNRLSIYLNQKVLC